MPRPALYRAAALAVVSLLVAMPANATDQVLPTESTTAESTVPLPVASPLRDTTSPRRTWPVMLPGRMGLGMTKEAVALAKATARESKAKISWERRPDCLDHNLQIIIDELAERFGEILVTSTCRTPEHNRRVGGVKNSQHIGGHAVDFYLYGDVHKAKEYLRAHYTVGGLGYYGAGRFHVDNGPVRNW